MAESYIRTTELGDGTTANSGLSYEVSADGSVKAVFYDPKDVTDAKINEMPVFAKDTDIPVSSPTSSLLDEISRSNDHKAFENKLNLENAKFNANAEKAKVNVLNNISTALSQLSVVNVSLFQATMESNRINEASQILASEQYIVSTAIKDTLVKIEKAITEQKLTANIENVVQDITVDASSLAEANAKIAEGVENQKATNAKLVEALAKQNEYYDFYNTGANALTAENLQKENIKLEKQTDYYDFLTDGKDTLKDSNGNVIKPREVKAKKDAEQLIEQADTNGTTFNDIESYLSDALGILEDGVENIVGSTDGFDLNFNPFRFLDDILVSDYMTNKDDAVNKP